MIIFCDNIMLFTIIPQEHTKTLNNVWRIKTNYCGINNTLLREIFSSNNIKIVPHSVKLF